MLNYLLAYSFTTTFKLCAPFYNRNTNFYLFKIFFPSGGGACL